MNTSVECFDLYKDRNSCGNVILNICCVRFVASFLLYIMECIVILINMKRF